MGLVRIGERAWRFPWPEPVRREGIAFGRMAWMLLLLGGGAPAACGCGVGTAVLSAVSAAARGAGLVAVDGWVLAAALEEA